MALATRDDLLRRARARTRQEIEEHEGSESAWMSNKTKTQDETVDLAAELFDYVDPTNLRPVARRYV